MRNEVKKKEKNGNRTKTEKKSFYWRVLDMRIRKWYIQEKEGAVKKSVEETET